VWTWSSKTTSSWEIWQCCLQWHRCDTRDGLDHRSQGCHLHFTTTCDFGTPRRDESHLRADEVLRHTSGVQSSHESNLRCASGLWVWGGVSRRAVGFTTRPWRGVHDQLGIGDCTYSLESVPHGRCLLTVKIHQPSHVFTFGVGISFIPYPLVLTPVV
jgi:hypothetical protein